MLHVTLDAEIVLYVTAHSPLLLPYSCCGSGRRAMLVVNYNSERIALVTCDISPLISWRCHRVWSINLALTMSARHEYSRLLNPDDKDGDVPVPAEAPTTRSRRTLIIIRFICLVPSLLIILTVLRFGYYIPSGRHRDELSVNDTSSIEKGTQKSEHMHGKLNVA